VKIQCAQPHIPAPVADLKYGMLHDFLKTNRALLIDRCRAMVARRSAPKLLHPELAHGIPIFLDQIIKTLAIEQQSDPSYGHLVPTQPDGGSDSEVGLTAMLHGRDLLQQGFTLEQVIRDYGDVCQAVTNLAVEIGAPILAGEFRTFNRCLDDAISAAVTQYSKLNRAALVEPRVPAPAPRTGNLDDLESTLTQTQMALAKTEAALSASQLEARHARTRALHDSLTRLPNRELFDDRLTQAIWLAGRHDWTLAVMFLDIDQFKSINDAHGHAAGDAVLKTVADRLLRHVRTEDTVCRNGGDEFLYLSINASSNCNVARIADTVLRVVAKPMQVGGLRVSVKISVGAAIYPKDGTTGDQLISHADRAMYRAKRHSRGVALFNQRDVDESVTVG